MARPKRCWYCGDPLNPKPGHHDSRTTEHLVAKANGGTDHRANVRLACNRCNSFVGSWPLEDKLKFRVLIRERGGWPGMRRRFGPRSGFAWRVKCELARMEAPRDAVSARAREALTVHRRKVSAATEPPAPGRVLVDAAPYVESGRLGPDDRHVAAWRFDIGGTVWQSKIKAYHRAREGAVARAVKAGVSIVRVLVPG